MQRRKAAEVEGGRGGKVAGTDGVGEGWAGSKGDQKRLDSVSAVVEDIIAGEKTAKRSISAPKMIDTKGVFAGGVVGGAGLRGFAATGVGAAKVGVKGVLRKTAATKQKKKTDSSQSMNKDKDPTTASASNQEAEEVEEEKKRDDKDGDRGPNDEDVDPEPNGEGDEEDDLWMIP